MRHEGTHTCDGNCLKKEITWSENLFLTRVIFSYEFPLNYKVTGNKFLPLKGLILTILKKNKEIEKESKNYYVEHLIEEQALAFRELVKQCEQEIEVQKE